MNSIKLIAIGVLCRPRRRRHRTGSPVVRTGDDDRCLRFGPGAAHVEAAVAGRDIVTMNEAHPVDAAGRAFQHVRLRQSEDDGGGAGHEIEERRIGLPAGAPGIELVGQVPAGAAERQLGRLRVGQIDQIGGGAAHRKAVNLAFQLSREVIAGIGPRRRCTGRDDERDQDRADYRAGHHEISNYLKSEPSRHEECTPRTVDLPILHDQ